MSTAATILGCRWWSLKKGLNVKISKYSAVQFLSFVAKLINKQRFKQPFEKAIFYVTWGVAIIHLNLINKFDYLHFSIKIEVNVILFEEHNSIVINTRPTFEILSDYGIQMSVLLIFSPFENPFVIMSFEEQ